MRARLGRDHPGVTVPSGTRTLLGRFIVTEPAASYQMRVVATFTSADDIEPLSDPGRRVIEIVVDGNLVAASIEQAPRPGATVEVDAAATWAATPAANIYATQDSGSDMGVWWDIEVRAFQNGGIPPLPPTPDPPNA